MVDKEQCPACGADFYEGKLLECPHCYGQKCSVCDMGNDTSCINCELDAGDLEFDLEAL